MPDVLRAALFAEQQVSRPDPVLKAVQRTEPRVALGTCPLGMDGGYGRIQSCAIWMGYVCRGAFAPRQVTFVQ